MLAQARLAPTVAAPRTQFANKCTLGKPAQAKSHARVSSKVYAVASPPRPGSASSNGSEKKPEKKQEKTPPAPSRECAIDCLYTRCYRFASCFKDFCSQRLSNKFSAIDLFAIDVPLIY